MEIGILWKAFRLVGLFNQISTVKCVGYEFVWICVCLRVSVCVSVYFCVSGAYFNNIFASATSSTLREFISKLMMYDTFEWIFPDLFSEVYLEIFLARRKLFQRH